MFFKIVVFFASIVGGFAQFYPGGGMAYGGAQPMGPSPRGSGDFYPMGGYPYAMPQVPRYMPNFYPAAPPHFSGAMGYGAAGTGVEQPASFPAPLMPASENTNENANTNVNINAGSYRRSLHSPSKEHGASRNANKNTNVNMQRYDEKK